MEKHNFWEGYQQIMVIFFIFFFLILWNLEERVYSENYQDITQKISGGLLFSQPSTTHTLPQKIGPKIIFTLQHRFFKKHREEVN